MLKPGESTRSLDLLKNRVKLKIQVNQTSKVGQKLHQMSDQIFEQCGWDGKWVRPGGRFQAQLMRFCMNLDLIEMRIFRNYLDRWMSPAFQRKAEKEQKWSKKTSKTSFFNTFWQLLGPCWKGCCPSCCLCGLEARLGR